MAYRQKEYNYNDKLTKDQNLLMDKLYKMGMSGMAEAFENQLMNPNSGLESFETRFSEIINHEWSGRENKKFNRLLKQATLKYPTADLDSSLDCQHFFRQIFLGYFSDIVQAFDTLRKNVCGDDYTSLHNPIVLSSVLPAYGMFHSIQILFL